MFALVVVLGAIAILVPVAIYPVSYTTWQAVDLAMRPPDLDDPRPRRASLLTAPTVVCGRAPFGMSRSRREGDDPMNQSQLPTRSPALAGGACWPAAALLAAGMLAGGGIAGARRRRSPPGAPGSAVAAAAATSRRCRSGTTSTARRATQDAVERYAAAYADANVEVEWFPATTTAPSPSALLTDDGPTCSRSATVRTST